MSLETHTSLRISLADLFVSLFGGIRSQQKMTPSSCRGAEFAGVVLPEGWDGTTRIHIFKKRFGTKLLHFARWLASTVTNCEFYKNYLESSPLATDFFFIMWQKIT